MMVEKKDVMFSTNLSKLFIWVYDDRVKEVMRK